MPESFVVRLYLPFLWQIMRRGRAEAIPYDPRGSVSELKTRVFSYCTLPCSEEGRCDTLQRLHLSGVKKR